MTTSPQNSVRSYKFLFGPVPSRRLGRSLGIDLVPLKTCTESCIFCQVGATNSLQIQRSEYVPTEEVIREFKDWLAADGNAEVVTLSGSGEPTLHSRFGDVLQTVRAACDIKTVLLSNGTLFWMPEVRKQAGFAHIVKASLSAWDQASFERINRPHPELRFNRIVDGLCALRSEFTSELWLEVFVLAGINDTPEAMQRIAAIAAQIAPDSIHINTVVRPPAESFAEPVSRERLDELAALFGSRAEVIAKVKADDKKRFADRNAVSIESVLQVLERRGCRVDDLALGLNVDAGLIKPLLERLLRDGRIHTEQRGAEVYFTAVAQGS